MAETRRTAPAPVEVLSGTLVGVECVLVRLEVSVAQGLPSISVVGLPQSAVREGKDRVRAALQAAGFALPPRRITVNLAPADLRKEGSGLDLPLAVGLLAASGHLSPEAAARCAFLGELGLNGEVRAVRGAVATAIACRAAGVRALFVPIANASEAAAGAGTIPVLPARTLTEVVRHLCGEHRIDPTPAEATGPGWISQTSGEDLEDVQGHLVARRVIEVAAAGGHHLLLSGPPGSGKTMLARRMRTVLPPLTPEEVLEVTAIHSVSGLLPPGEAVVRERPFRAPHHTASSVALIGGGSPVRPGEVSLAHRGILFLDELPEFSRSALETLRQPLEDGWISITRARDRLRLPARFILVAAMNLCPCGHRGDFRRSCNCDPSQVERYRSRISGPLLDRIDLRVGVSTVPYRELTEGPAGESSATVRGRVERARVAQRARWSAEVEAMARGRSDKGRVGGSGSGQGVSARIQRDPCWNATLPPIAVRLWCRPDPDGDRLLEYAADRRGLSARGIHRVLKVARTIADLDASPGVLEKHLAEALHYRE